MYSVFDLLLNYLQQGRITIDDTVHPGPTTLHDSCSYGRKSLKSFGKGYFDEARTIIRLCCPEFVDPVPSRQDAYCCGAGGGGWSLPWAAERIFQGRIRAEQIRRSGARRLIVACPTCRDQFSDILNREMGLGITIKYIWEMIADALVLSEQ